MSAGGLLKQLKFGPLHSFAIKTLGGDPKNFLDPFGLFTSTDGTPDMPAPPAPVKRDDPAISAAQKKQREADLRRRGRRASIVTGGQGVLGDAPLLQPQARGAQVLG